MSEHTPGPWEATAAHCNSWHIRDGHGIQMYFLGCGTGYPIDEHKANAHLIAAAPDLLAALNRFDVEGLELEGDEEIDITMTAEDLRILRAAIAKAKGGKP